MDITKRAERIIFEERLRDLLDECKDEIVRLTARIRKIQEIIDFGAIAYFQEESEKPAPPSCLSSAGYPPGARYSFIDKDNLEKKEPTQTTPIDDDELYRNEAPVCPWCGDEYSEPWDLDMSDGEEMEIICDICEKPFTVKCEIEYYYTTSTNQVDSSTKEKE